MPSSMLAGAVDHAYPLSRLESMLPARGLPLLVNRPRHNDPSPFHDHDFIEVAVVRSGDAIHRGIFGERAIGRGDCIVLHPGQWHGYARCGGIDLCNLCLPIGLFAHDLAWLAADPQIAGLLPPVRHAGPPSQQVIHLHLEEADLIPVLAACDRLLALLARPEAMRARTEIIAQAATVLAALGAAAPRRHVPDDEDATVAALASAMAADLAVPWKLAELARRAGMTREHLCRRFRAVHGMPPLAWLTRRRAERAAVLLLSTDAPVADIGRQVGWDDPNYCARRFRAAFGVNPAAYRRKAPPVMRG